MYIYISQSNQQQQQKKLYQKIHSKYYKYSKMKFETYTSKQLEGDKANRNTKRTHRKQQIKWQTQNLKYQ